MRGGDTFSLTLPPELDAVILSWDLTHPDGTTIAQCTTSGSPTVLTCEFTAAVSDYSYVSGGVWVQAQADQSTDSETVDLGTVTGTVPVDLPGTGGIQPGVPTYPTEIDKWGWFQGDDRDQVHWEIYIPGNDPNIDPTVQLTIKDTVSAGQTILGDVEVQSLVPGTTSDWVAVTDGVTVTPDADGAGFTIDVAANTFSVDGLYRIVYNTSKATTNIGQTYTNEASIAGYPASDTVTRTQEGGTVDLAVFPA